MQSVEKTKELRIKMLAHLDAAMALADEAGDKTTAYLIECALIHAKADQWPAMNPQFDTTRR